MVYRTKTYIAADWTGDQDAVQQLYKWNDSNYWGLSFTDAHESTQSYDSSLFCTIKRSLRERMNSSKTFVLIVGEKTKSLIKGNCSYCNSYNSWTGICAKGNYVDHRSYIEYECEQAIKAGIKIVVLYHYANVNKSKCPECIKDYGKHINMYYYDTDGKCYWNYSEIKSAIND